MKFAYISCRFHCRNEAFTRREVKYLKRQGHEITMLFPPLAVLLALAAVAYVAVSDWCDLKEPRLLVRTVPWKRPLNGRGRIGR